jgi:hypothetical protein
VQLKGPNSDIFCEAFFQWMQNLIQYFLWLVKPNVTTSLQQKKFRQIHKLFIAEGAKVIQRSYYQIL